MRLVYIHNIAMPGPEANTVNVAKMCSAFAGLGHDVTLIAATGDGAEGDLAACIQDFYGLKHAFKVVPLPRLAKRPALAAVFGGARARQTQPDLVITRAPHAALACCTLGLRTALEVHADLSAFSPLGRAAFERVIRRPNLAGMIVISDALARYYEELYPVLSGRLCVAHDGADVHEAAGVAAKNQPLQVGYVGRLYPGRGVDIIAAAARLSPAADFHIVGGGADDMRRLAGPLPDNVHCHGSIPHAQVAQRIASFDVVVAPYQRSVIVADGRTDTARWMSPLKLFEYMACGKAIVASDLPAIREVLRDGETALLCTPDDAAQWADAINRLGTEPALRDRLGQAARARFEQHHTWSKRAEHILGTLEGGRRKRAAA